MTVEIRRLVTQAKKATQMNISIAQSSEDQPARINKQSLHTKKCCTQDKKT